MQLETSPRLGVTSIAANNDIIKLFKARSADELRRAVAQMKTSGWFYIVYNQPIPDKWYAIRDPENKHDVVFKSTFISAEIADQIWSRICTMNRIEKREAKALAMSNNSIEAVKRFPFIYKGEVLGFQKP